LGGCGHIFHTHCIEERLKRRWASATISYAFLDCPLCAVPISHHILAPLLQPLHRARDALEARYVERLRLEGLLTHPDIASNAASPFFNSPVAWARANLTYYECRRCKRPYFGGLRECAALLIDDGGGDGGGAAAFGAGGGGNANGIANAAGAANEEERGSREDLICGGCVAVEAGVAICATHGPTFAEYKCKYCCNMAVWYCWGTTHFCDLCHTPPRKSVREECKGEELCPLRARHPANGVEFMAGCSACRVIRAAGGDPHDASAPVAAAVPPPAAGAVGLDHIANPLAPRIPAH
jgi:E3 ubiquitin-protein ligase MYCBP2